MIYEQIYLLTGSKGKTTILFLLQHIIKYCESKKNILSVSSTEGMYYNKKFVRNAFVKDYFDNRTPEGKSLQYDYFISEATSNMLMYGHYDNIDTTVAIFTGLEETEHLDVHKTFENYLFAKKKLFDNLDENSHAIICIDNKYYKRILEDCKCKNIHTYGFSKKAAYTVTVKTVKKTGQKINITNNNKDYLIKSNLLGDFNALNTTVAFIFSKILNFNTKQIAKSIYNFSGIRGRFQRFYLSNNNIAIIDYAHTANSLKKVLETIKSIYSDSKIISIFGCGGNKSVEKRPLMGENASKFSDYTILTNDNLRLENGMNIINNIKNGIDPSNTNYKVILDRKEAIKDAILNNRGAIILIAGKGAEEITEYSESNILDSNNKPKLLVKKESDLQLLSEIVSENKLKMIQGQNSGIMRLLFPR
jgi:UDP-N-acetylmuramyl-tripeptide synthetase